MLIEKYQRQLEEDSRYRVARGIKQDRFFEAQNTSNLPGSQCAWEPQRRILQHARDWAPRIRQNTRFANQVGSDNPDRWVNHANLLHGGDGPSSCKQEQTEEHAVMVGSWLCRVSSKIHINRRCVSYLVREDKGKAAAMGQEDEKDLKRAHVVLSQGCKVLGTGYSPMSSRDGNGSGSGRVEQLPARQ
jgi:hypothetical protein